MFQLLATALLLWGLWVSPLGKAKRTGLILLVLALVFSLWTTVEYFITCAEAAGKIRANATSFGAKLRSLLDYKAAKEPKMITKTGDFNTRVRKYKTLRNDMTGLPSRITANCASYTEAKLKKAVDNSDSNVSDIQKYETKVAKAK